MNIDPKNPFNWYLRTEPSIFAKDPYFRPKGPEKRTGSQIMSEHVEKMRAKGESPGTIHALGGRSTKKDREKELLAYKQFGTYSKAAASKKPNKHEAGGKK